MTFRQFVPLVLACALFLAVPHDASAAISQSFQQTGQLGLEVDAAAGGNMFMANGSLSLSNVPAVPVKAFFYATDWQSGGAQMTGNFNGFPLAGAIITSDTTLPGISYTHRWDVTTAIAGPGTFNYSLTGLGPGVDMNHPMGSLIAGVGLVVVYNDPNASPNTIVTIMDGSQQLGEGLTIPETETIQFMNLIAGPTTIYNFTTFDDNADTGETVKYNGNTIGGPIDQSLGFDATLLQMSATSIAGNNSLSLTNGPATPNVDHMFWVFAASIVVPEPSTALLLLLALSSLGLHRLRRR